MKEKGSHGVFIAVAVLLLLPVLYVGSYFWFGECLLVEDGYTVRRFRVPHVAMLYYPVGVIEATVNATCVDLLQECNDHRYMTQKCSSLFD
jgi:hypothetical protein